MYTENRARSPTIVMRMCSLRGEICLNFSKNQFFTNLFNQFYILSERKIISMFIRITETKNLHVENITK